MRTQVALGIATLTLLAPAMASAFDFPSSFTEAPKGAGVEQPAPAPGAGRVVPGFEAEGNLGSGFTSTYGLALGARAGYTLKPGVYVGGAVTYYQGTSLGTPAGSASNHATWLGAEAGYKFFPRAHWELRPYVFAGPAIVSSSALRNDIPLQTTTTRFGVQPGFLTAYHFGQAFISAEARYYATPAPNALTLLGGAGLSF